MHKKIAKINMQKAMTLMEMLIVSIIIGILAAIIIPNFIRARERGMDKQGRLMVEAIGIGEKYYRLRHGVYYGPEGNIDDINSNLTLDLNEVEWNCGITGGGATYTATCSRSKGGYSRSWEYTSVLPQPTCGGSCP